MIYKIGLVVLSQILRRKSLTRRTIRVVKRTRKKK